MSHRGNAGFNGAGLSVSAGQPDDVGPRSATAACRGSWSIRVRVEPSGFVPVRLIPGESFQSRAEGVTQPARSAICA